MEFHPLLNYPLLKHLPRAIAEPSKHIVDPVERHHAARLSGVLAAFLPLLLIMFLIAAAINQFTAGMWIGLGALLTCYALSRTRYYNAARITTLVVFCIMPLLNMALISTYEMSTRVVVVEWMVMAMFVSWLLLSTRYMLLYVWGSFVGVAIIAALRHNFESTDILFLFSFMTLMTLIALMLVMIRQEATREREASEKVLREREERYRLINQVMSDYAFSVRILPGPVWSLEWVEGAWTRITGIPLEKALETQWLDLIHKDDLPVLKANEQKVLEGIPSVTEYRLIDRGGNIHWIRHYDYPIWDEAQKRVTQVYGAIQDVTERKRAEEHAEEQRRMAEALRDTAAVLSSTLDQDEVLDRILDEVYKVTPSDAADIMLIEMGSIRVARMRGYEKGDPNGNLRNLRFGINDIPSFHEMYITGKSCFIPDIQQFPAWVIFPGIEWVRSYVGVPIVLDGITMGFINATSGKVGNFTQMHAAQLRAFADQAAIAIRNALLFDEVRRYADALGSIVIERNNELTFERERMQAILDASGEGIVYTEDQKIRYVNTAFAQLTGYDVDALMDQSMVMLRDPKTSAEEMALGLERLQHYLNDGNAIWRGEYDIQRRDGSIFTAGITVSPVKQPDDGVMRTVSIVRDITREKIIREQQSQFVAHASHELRTPITNFKTRLHLLRRDPTHLEDHITVMEEVSDRMRRLINDLLDLNRFERGTIPLQRHPMVLQSLIVRVVRAQRAEAENKGLLLHLEVPDSPLIVYVDEERMIQVITNLVINAINYTPTGGHIWASVQMSADEKYGIVRVRDTGIGISPENLPLIFQPFFRVPSEVEGTGLGLSIARELIRQHGGTINVSSQVGNGSTFEIHIPLYTRELRAAPSSDNPTIDFFPSSSKP